MGQRVEIGGVIKVGDASVQFKTLQRQGCLDLVIWACSWRFAGQGPAGLAAPLSEGLGTFKNGAQRQ
jgi:hypothetical protein